MYHTGSKRCFSLSRWIADVRRLSPAPCCFAHRRQFCANTVGSPLTFFKLNSCYLWLHTEVKHKTREIVQNHALGLRWVWHRKCREFLSLTLDEFFLSPSIWNYSDSRRKEHSVQTSRCLTFPKLQFLNAAIIKYTKLLKKLTFSSFSVP